MKFVADVHLHSHFSRATSKTLNLEQLSKWAQLKGVTVVGTGDIAHPGWLQEMKDRLEPAEPGLFRLKQELSRSLDAEVFKACRMPVRFMLAGEISNIYKKNDKVRKIHHVVFMPSFEALEKFQAKLETIGNIRSDGRPILGLDSRDLLEIVLETDPQGYLIPAHIWTPWFALLGSMSGFDSVEECFDDLTEHIFAVETGLSSDPPMNWRLSMLDKYTLVSNSDAHSPQKLAREANIFDTELSYPAIFEALKSGNQDRFLGTIEFFPEEGKYHYDGHRKCKLRWGPRETLANHGLCPVCGKKVTVGVMHRVETLADREPDVSDAGRHPFHSLVPLPEVLAEIHNVGPNSKRVQEGYEFLLSRLGSELHILQEAPLEDIERLAGPMVAEGIRRMRTGELDIAAGYDGEYGTIRIFNDNERQSFSAQLGFFVDKVKAASGSPENVRVNEAPAPYKKKVQRNAGSDAATASEKTQHSVGNRQRTEQPALAELNHEQQMAAACTDGALMIVAGPGTGKTKTLTFRIAHLIRERRVAPEQILAITFTNKAAHEICERLHHLLDGSQTESMTVCTFHAFCLHLLEEKGDRMGIPPDFTICSERQRANILRRVQPHLSARDINTALEAISWCKNQLLPPDACTRQRKLPESLRFAQLFEGYQARLKENGCLDLDDLLARTVDLLQAEPEILAECQARYQWLLVDEYQDLNPAQYKLLRQLSARCKSLCVVGDPDQAIYGFRGANREFFMRFSNEFTGARQIVLNRNYRSTQTILDAAAQVLADHKANPADALWSEIASTARVEFYTAPTDRAEAEYVVHTIEKMVGGTSYFSIDSGRLDDEQAKPDIAFGDIGVLYRLKSQSQLLKEAFDRSGMPYQTVGDAPFIERKAVRDILSHLWFLLNPHDDVHLEGVLRSTSAVGVGAATVDRMLQAANSSKQSLWHTLLSYATIDGLHTKQRSALAALARRLTHLQNFSRGQHIADIIRQVASSIGDDWLLDECNSQIFQQLLLRAAPYADNLAKFLRASALSSETDDYDARADRITLMTLHASKGLEFPVVFIVGCEDNLIPFIQQSKETDIDEERRLLYVGMTRAQSKLTLTCARSRVHFGAKIQPRPSRFLRDIKEALLEVKKARLHRKGDPTPSSPQIELF